MNVKQIFKKRYGLFDKMQQEKPEKEKQDRSKKPSLPVCQELQLEDYQLRIEVPVFSEEQKNRKEDKNGGKEMLDSGRKSPTESVGNCSRELVSRVYGPTQVWSNGRVE